MDVTGPERSTIAPGSIFAQPWWLDAVAPGSWNEISIRENGRLLARLPYVRKRSRGFTHITMPLLTQHLGPWLHSYAEKTANRLADEKRLMTEIIDRLPPFDSFSQHFHHSISNWLPFYWRGFQQTTRYTYVLEQLRDLDAVWKGMRENIRREVRKATKMVTVRDDLGLDAVYELNRKTFGRQGLAMPYSRELVARIDEGCARHGCRRALFAEDAQGRLHAAAYIVWDEQAAYYLIGGGDPDLRNSGAMSLLLWEAIQFAATVTQTFDFEGSMIEPVERFFRAFGSTQKPYFRVTKTTSARVKMAADVRSWMRLSRAQLREKRSRRGREEPSETEES